MGNDFSEIFGDWPPDDFDEKRRPEPGDADEPENRKREPVAVREVKIRGVFEHTDVSTPLNGQTFVLLEDRDDRKVPIWIGRYEAISISMALDGAETGRPMTHDLIKLILERLNAQVDRITVDDLWEETFYAKISLISGDKTIDIDARPSDAIALAVRFKAPIYVAETVLAAVTQEQEQG